MNETTSQFLKIAGVCGIVGTILLLAIDVVLITTGRMFEWSIGMWLAFLLMIPAVLGFTYYLASRGSRLAYVAGGFAFFGLMAGASMQVLFACTLFYWSRVRPRSWSSFAERSNSLPRPR